jgi:hypothetical protein
MSLSDFINACFEFFGSVTIWLNVRQILKDKCYNGLTLLAVLFFAAWGYWNLYYYPHLNQWLSFIAGISVTIANTTWFCLMLYYGRGK